ncbi:MAG: pre-peptidase C-terminal domain-containing protein [Kofleriaceae bacterium]
MAVAAHIGGLAMVASCVGGTAPELLGMTDEVGQVGVELKVDLDGTDPDGDKLSYSFVAAGIEDIGTRATVTVSPSGAGVFRWTPIAEDVGDHAIDFTVSDGDHDTTVTINISIKSAIGAATVPRFIQPLAGTSIDLEKQDCLDLDVVIDDQDSAQVTIDQMEPLIPGSELTQDGGHTATWHWCPTKAQAAEYRHTLYLTADDGDNPKKIKELVFTVREGTGSTCPGTGPVIGHTVTNPMTILDIPVTASVEDDKGLKGPPMLYFSHTPPAEPVDPQTMTQVEMTVVNGKYTAIVANPAAMLPAGMTASVYYVIVAADDDDATGTCDHTTISPLYTMKVTSTGVANSAACEACSHDTQCGMGDLCVYMGAMNASYCLQSCVSGCPTGFTCSAQKLPSVDGASDYQCVPQSGSCEMPQAPCEDDIWEDNDTLADAMANPSLVPNANYDLVSCPGDGAIAVDDDWYKITVTADAKVTLTLTGEATTDLDLRLYEADGSSLTSSNSPIASEKIILCLTPGTYYARVLGGDAQNLYSLNFESSAQSCTSTCTDDNYEQDDTFSQSFPTLINDGILNRTVFERTTGKICSGDDDWYRVPLFTGNKLIMDLTFVHSPLADLDIHLYKNGVDQWPCDIGNSASQCSIARGQGSASNEHAEFIAPAGCETTACVYDVVVHGYANSTNSYSLKLQLQ